MYRKTTLQNGFRIITQKIASTQAATVLVLVGAGSRCENQKIRGISHFLEHMFFKGAHKFKNAREVSEAIDGVGGDFNAFTGKEYAGYFIKTHSDHTKLSMDLISDMLINATFLDEEITKERGVIMEEYNMYQDTPMYQVSWDFETLLYGNQPMGWDQIGLMDVIKTVTRQEFIDYKKALYTPDNSVLIVSGDVDHDEIVKMAEKMYKFEEKERTLYPAELMRFEETDKVSISNKKTEQTHVVCGFEGLGEQDPDYIASKVLAVILGGNMSSRMFMNVREQKGLAYYISTSSEGFTDTGVFATKSGVSVDKTKDAITAIIEEYKRCLDEDIPEKELIKGREFIKGKMTLKLEDSEEYAHILGMQELLFNHIKTPSDMFKEVDKVTVADLKRVAERVFKEENLKLALIGPYTDKAEFEALLKF